MPKRTHRRDFLKTSAALAAGGVWIAGADRPACSASPNEKLNIGLIGTGGRARGNLAGVASQNIVALCDIDEQRLAATAEQYPQANKYTDFRKLLDQPGLDAVVVSTPDHTHAVASVMALRAGKHVYCEKPLAHSVFEARTMAETAARSGLVTQMGNQGHSSARFKTVVGLVSSGAIGPVREVHTWCAKSYVGGDRPADTPEVPGHIHWDLWLGPAAYRPYHPRYLPFVWRGWWDFGTATLGDMACHIMDAPFTALGLDYPSRIEAEGPPVHAESCPSWLVVRYDFPARDDRPPVRLSWYDGERAPPWKRLGEVEVPNQGSLFVGQKGKLLFPHGRGSIVVMPNEGGGEVERIDPQEQAGSPHHEEWIALCKSGGTAGSDFAYGGRLTESVLAGVVAYRAAMPLEWDGRAMRAANCPQAERFIRPEYREGWKL